MNILLPLNEQQLARNSCACNLEIHKLIDKQLIKRGNYIITNKERVTLRKSCKSWRRINDQYHHHLVCEIAFCAQQNGQKRLTNDFNAGALFTKAAIRPRQLVFTNSPKSGKTKDSYRNTQKFFTTTRSTIIQRVKNMCIRSDAKAIHLKTEI